MHQYRVGQNLIKWHFLKFLSSKRVTWENYYSTTKKKLILVIFFFCIKMDKDIQIVTVFELLYLQHFLVQWNLKPLTRTFYSDRLREKKIWNSFSVKQTSTLKRNICIQYSLWTTLNLQHWSNQISKQKRPEILKFNKNILTFKNI